MQEMFEALLGRMKEPMRFDRGLKTDNSILLVYPPDRELDFREQLLDAVVPVLQAESIPFDLFDLEGFMFRGLRDRDIEALQEDEFDDYRWMLQGLATRVERSFLSRISEMATKRPGLNVLVYGTAALHPVLRFGEILTGLRDLHCRIALGFPGEERAGKLHFMNQPDGGNYLAMKLFWR